MTIDIAASKPCCAWAGRVRYGPAVNSEDGVFGEAVAARYDQFEAEMFEPGVIGATVEFLAGLAGDGRALELAIGTGRIALPLAARGVPVDGIDMSRAMVARLRAKPVSWSASATPRLTSRPGAAS